MDNEEIKKFAELEKRIVDLEKEVKELKEKNRTLDKRTSGLIVMGGNPNV